MRAFLSIKQQLMRFYTRYEAFVLPVLKFLAMLFSLIIINKNVGYMTKLKNPAIVLILALVCSFMPSCVIVLIAGIVIVAHLYALSLQCAVVVLILFIIMYVLYLRFTPKDAIAILLTPVMYALRIPYVMPLSLGFVGNPLSAISVGCGSVVYYVLQYIKNNEDSLRSETGVSDLEGTLSGFKGVIDGLLKNDEMLLMVVVFAALIVIVYLIRRMKVNYSWQIALGVGFVMGIVLMISSSSALDVDISMGGVVLGMILSTVIVLILQFFVFNVDYSRAEYVQFEDDEYYYYVKAVPKVTAPSSRSNSRREEPDEDDEDDYYE